MPHQVERGLERARRAIQFGSHLSVSEHLLQVIEYFPWRKDLVELAGQYAIQGGGFERGVDLLQKVARTQNLSPRSHIALGDAALDQGNPEIAIQAWTSALEAGGDPLLIYPRLSQTHLALGDIDTAIEYLQKITQLEPSNATANYRLGLLLATRDPESALPYLTQAMALDPSLEGSMQTMWRSLRTARLSDNLAYMLLTSGRELAALEEWQLAEEAFHQASIAQPDYAEAWAFLGEARQHISTDKYSDGIIKENLERALALDPDSVVANTLMALYWQRQERYDLALVYLHAAADEEPENPSLQIELGNTLAQLGKITSAQKYYQRAVELAPDNPTFWRSLASFSINYDINLDEVGLPAARQAVVLDPDNPASLLVMGQVFSLLDDDLLAERFLRRALRNDPGYAPARLHLGLLYLTQGNISAAQEQLFLAQSLAPPDTPTSVQANRVLRRYFP